MSHGRWFDLETIIMGEYDERRSHYGHHPLKIPFYTGWRIAVDTGAVWTNKLIAVVLERSVATFFVNRLKFGGSGSYSYESFLFTN